VTIPLIVLAVGLAMLLIERRKRARDWPVVVGWWPRAIAANAVQAGLAFITGVAWDGWMLRHRPWTLEDQGVLTQAALSYLVITFVYYWWHRWRHEWPFLWRWLHQFHHSPQRIELLTSFYKHPFEIALNALLSSAIIYLVVGAEPLAASIAVTMTGLAEFVYHWNIATPHWLGYVIQRPESHCAHHEEGLHHFNYADLPLWDMLFGTFRNPTQWNGRCGFGDNQEQRVTELLMGREIGMATSSDGAP
jgi:sterol desaturase/sphingolipid hydroxylase (fatty acid hydroxylase superfamily)